MKSGPPTLYLHALAISAGLLLLAGCTANDDRQTGITTIGNTVAGTVVDDKGTLVTNAEVRLIREDYNPSNDAAETGYHVVRTDAKGHYVFQEIEAGGYNLEVAKDGLAAYVRGLKLTKERPEDTAPRAELSKPGAITLVFGKSAVKLGGHCFMPGTTRHRRIDAEAQRIGSLTLPYVAAGRYESLRYQSPEESTGTEVLAPRVLDVVPEDTLIVTANGGWAMVRKISLNTSPTGANVTGDLFGFPILVRLTSANLDFSLVRKDGADIRFAKPDGSPMAYELGRWDSAAGTAEVWVKMDTAYGATRSQSFYLLAGNKDSVDASDGKAVFGGGTRAGVWHFDDANLTDVVEGNSAVNHGAESVEGLIGKAVRFRGTAWIDVPAKAFEGITRKISISFWQKSGDTLQTSPGDIFGATDADGSVVLRMHDPFGDTTVYWQAGALDTARLDKIEKRTDAEAENRNRWNHWVVSKDADKGEMKIYLNGKIWQSAGGKTASIGKVQSFILAFSGTDAYALDDFRISRLPGSDDWVKLNYETQKAGTTAVSIGK